MKTTCEKCGEPLVLLTSLNLKICSECGEQYEWKLSEGQQPIFSEKPIKKS